MNHKAVGSSRSGDAHNKLLLSKTRWMMWVMPGPKESPTSKSSSLGAARHNSCSAVHVPHSGTRRRAHGAVPAHRTSGHCRTCSGPTSSYKLQPTIPQQKQQAQTKHSVSAAAVSTVLAEQGGADPAGGRFQRRARGGGHHLGSGCSSGAPAPPRGVLLLYLPHMSMSLVRHGSCKTSCS